MNNIYKVNHDRNQSAVEIAAVLNNCNMLLNLELEDRVNRIILHVVTDSVSAQYSEVEKDGMINFLTKLREHTSNKDDVDELIEEIQYLQYESDLA